jgi:hypothetical protein
MSMNLAGVFGVGCRLLKPGSSEPVWQLAFALCSARLSAGILLIWPSSSEFGFVKQLGEIFLPDRGLENRVVAYAFAVRLGPYRRRLRLEQNKLR